MNEVVMLHPNNPSKVVGKITGRVYTTKRTGKHYFYKYKGFGISQSIIDELLKRGVIWIKIEYESGSKIAEYLTHVDNYNNSTITHEYMGDYQKIVEVHKMKTLKEEVKLKPKIGYPVNFTKTFAKGQKRIGDF